MPESSKRKHIALVSRGGSWWLGGRQYTANLAMALAGLPTEIREKFKLSIVVGPSNDIASFEHLRGVVDELLVAEERQEPYTLANRVRWRMKRQFGTSINPRFEEFLECEGVDFAYPCMLSSQWGPRVHAAMWIADFQYDHFPDGSNAAEIAGRKAEWEQVTRLAPLIVLSSEAAEKDCHRLFPASIGRTKVLRFRVTLPSEQLQPGSIPVEQIYGLPNRYFVVSNLFAPTKNHKVVFEALRILAGGGPAPLVVFTGDTADYRNPGFFNDVLRDIHTNGIWPMARVLGVVPRQDQLSLMRRSVGVIQPSLFEGWNTGVEEAHCLGKRVLLSDIEVHREQNPARGAFFDPHSPEMLAQLMAKAWAAQQQVGEHDLELAAIREYRELVDIFAYEILSLFRWNPRSAADQQGSASAPR